jgi:hypothetical protein
MKKQIKSVALAVAAGVVAASAQAATNNGDLLLGFTDQTHNDVIFDLGPASSLAYGNSWNLGATGFNLLGNLNLGSVYWGVIGDNLVGATGTAWATKGIGTPAPGKLAGLSAWGAIDTPISSIFQNFSTTGAGNYISVDPANSAAYPNGWNVQTISGTLTTDYHKAYLNPNVQGLNSDSLYQIVANNSAPTVMGYFNLDATGTITYTASPVPEPSSLALLTGAGLLALSLRNRFRNKLS